ncbi:uncharacterized protein C7orf50 homolog [Limulus polyphemus]|uniref:Uncharacterized protein C7orf50 homolog n=1 Tax=Limulus polyphemus TaxID=6850 RepID=A0ABM1T275_LIMPO|nr:uncharacterized protein C7orf50 homolog [Limulus polyphemus]XP_022249979.1 uncharacterized protein C7orf50 homolog [Limulus polyphemus]XP_022249980.1 uncharacterized protein C7orf50 homolog [Limulus polyphemus]XP_022249981.1 uncharacterized protein C7orf50 homolog [Limulus polyphemus]
MQKEGISKKHKQKSKKKAAKESKTSVLEKAHKYVEATITSVEDKSGQYENKRKLETDFGEGEEVVFKRKATEADKERKREKSRLKRQKKKEQKAKKHSEETGAKAKENALLYLKLWHTDRHNWSFKKIQQIWLLKNLYQTEQISDDEFEILLEYLVGLKGAARERLVEEAEKLIRTWEIQLQTENPGSDDERIGLNDRARSFTDLCIGEKVTESGYNRARMIIQMLE